MKWPWQYVQGWYDDAAKDLPTDVSKLGKFLLGKVVALADLLHHDITGVYDTLTAEIGSIDTIVTGLGELALGSLESVGGDITKLREWTSHELGTLVDGAVKGIDKTVHSIYEDAGAWFHEAEAFTDSHVTWFYDKVIRPAIHDAEVAADVIDKDAKKVADDVFHDLIKPIEHDLSEAWHDANKAVSWIDHEGMDAVHLVEKSWDWLEWFALHSFKELESLPSETRALFTPAGAMKTAEADSKAVFAAISSGLEEMFPAEKTPT